MIANLKPDEIRAAIIEHLRDIRVQFLSSLEGLTEEQMLEPSIDGWSVRDHLNHLAFWHELRASEIERVSAGYQHVWPHSVDSQALNDIVQPARAHLSLAQARWEYDEAIERAISAVDSASEKGLTPDLYGEVGLHPMHDIGHAEFIRNWRTKR